MLLTILMIPDGAGTRLDIKSAAKKTSWKSKKKSPKKKRNHKYFGGCEREFISVASGATACANETSNWRVDKREREEERHPMKRSVITVISQVQIPGVSGSHFRGTFRGHAVVQNVRANQRDQTGSVCCCSKLFVIFHPTLGRSKSLFNYYYGQVWRRWTVW